MTRFEQKVVAAVIVAWALFGVYIFMRPGILTRMFMPMVAN